MQLTRGTRSCRHGTAARGKLVDKSPLKCRPFWDTAAVKRLQAEWLYALGLAITGKISTVLTGSSSPAQLNGFIPGIIKDAAPQFLEAGRTLHVRSNPQPLLEPC